MVEERRKKGSRMRREGSGLRGPGGEARRMRRGGNLGSLSAPRSVFVACLVFVSSHW